MALEKPGKLREFFLLLRGHPGSPNADDFSLFVVVIIIVITSSSSSSSISHMLVTSSFSILHLFIALCSYSRLKHFLFSTNLFPLLSTHFSMPVDCSSVSVGD